MTWLVGTCGWQYRDWRGRFYPKDVAQAHWLEHYSSRFSTVEIDSSFYRLPERSSFERWAAATPDGFCFAAKASRYLTHVRRLSEPQEPVARLMERMEGLGERAGPVLVQLPPNFAADHDRLEATLRAFPAGTRVAVEFRHPSWDVPRSASILTRHDAARCLVDRRGTRGPWERTASWGYVRFHEGRADPPGCYGRRSLYSAADRLADVYDDSDDLYVYFNNDPHGCAVLNAATLRSRLTAVGHDVR